jgi:hypothetical protein
MRSIAYPAHAAVLTRFGSQLRCAPGWESAGVLGQAFSASRGSNRTRTIRLTPTTTPTSLGSTSLIHRIEVTCAACGGHLEHVFAGGPGDTGGLPHHVPLPRARRTLTPSAYAGRQALRGVRRHGAHGKHRREIAPSCVSK